MSTSHFERQQPSYEALRDVVAERTRGVIAWVGSGLSADADLPSWASLKQRLVEALNVKARTFSEQDRDRLARASRSIGNEKDHWIAFQMLKRHLGPTTYRDTIREVFKNVGTAPIPRPYRDLWKLRVQGVLNLNIDRLATRAFVSEFPDTVPTEFSGSQVGNVTHVLEGSRKPISRIRRSL